MVADSIEYSADIRSPGNERSGSGESPRRQIPTATRALSVIIVNYNVRDFLKQALSSVQKACADVDAEIIVVDNDSADGSVEMIKSSFPDVTLVENTQNIGFSRANNQAIAISRGEFIVLLNPDTLVSEDSFSVMMDFLRDHDEAGAVGCQILHPNGKFARESRRAFPTPFVAFCRVAGLSTLFPKSRIFGRYNMSYLPVDQVAEVDALSGSCMMVRRRALLESGPNQSHPREEVDSDTPRLLDEAFFMYGEDLDWCYRIQKAGWKIFYTPDTQIIHYKGESTRKGELRYVKLFYGAMVRFSRKHFKGYGRLVVELLRVAIVFKAVLSVVARLVRTSLPVVIDFSVVWVSVVTAAMIRANSGFNLPAPLFMMTVAPAFSIVTVLGIGLSRGYQRSGRSIRSVVVGLLLALLVVSAGSFFIKQIAFSRLVVLLSVPIAAVLLGALRLHSRYRASSISRAALVGSNDDAAKLLEAVRVNPNPSFELVGIIPVGESTQTDRLPTLGRFDQLRDIVRLRNIDTVVISSGSIPNWQIFDSIRQLRDLPVTFRMLADTHDRVISKASIRDLATPRMVAVDEYLRTPRSAFEKRTFDLVFSIAAVLLYPFRIVLSGFRLRAVNSRTIEFLQVIANKKTLVGARPKARQQIGAPLKEGVYSIVDVLPGPLDEESIMNAYTFYLENESAQLDWDIVMRSFRNPPESDAGR
ncbi:MAG: glycosyltransferase [Rhodothermales bacterium]|nr:glycosyltransferase [Rhodothermales bacterium]